MQDLRELRRMAGWTQAKASRTSGINRAKLSQAECGEIELSAKEQAAVRRVLLGAIRDRVDRINSVLADAEPEPMHA